MLRIGGRRKPRQRFTVARISFDGLCRKQGALTDFLEDSQSRKVSKVLRERYVPPSWLLLTSWRGKSAVALDVYKRRRLDGRYFDCITYRVASSSLLSWSWLTCLGQLPHCWVFRRVSSKLSSLRRSAMESYWTRMISLLITRAGCCSSQEY
jgi:hypothetical protein